MRKIPYLETYALLVEPTINNEVFPTLFDWTTTVRQDLFLLKTQLLRFYGKDRTDVCETE